MKLSIVSTLYQSAPYVEEFYERVTVAAKQLAGDDYEIILVNDGSPDNSLDLAIRLTEHDSHVVVVDLSRNFGHHKAMIAGLEQARGERIFLIDSDLEEEPEWLLDFDAAMASEEADVIYGVQTSRKGGWFERWSGAFFYSLFNYMAHIDHPRNIVTARLMSRRYLNSFMKFGERELIISCLWIITGFKQCALNVEKHCHSPTTYSFFKKLGHFTNAIISFSAFPLKLVFLFGVFIFFVAAIIAAYLISVKLIYDVELDGWISIMISIWALGGLILSSIGVLGIYISKVFIEVKQRPLFIVRQIYRGNDLVN